MTPIIETKQLHHVYSAGTPFEREALRGVDFAEGAKRFTISAACTGSATLTVRLDSPEGEVVGTVTIKPTGKIEKYRSFKTKINGAEGVHDLYLCFDEAEGDIRLDWWKFE